MTLWTTDCQVLLSIGFSRQENWNELPFPSPGDLPNPGFKTVSPSSAVMQADSLPAEPLKKPIDEEIIPDYSSGPNAIT